MVIVSARCGAIAMVSTFALGIPSAPQPSASRDMRLTQGCGHAHVSMPFIGLGTGGYDSLERNSTVVIAQVKNWLAEGGRRIDTAQTYNSQPFISTALKESGVKRSDVFINSKVGVPDPDPWGWEGIATMGFDDVQRQIDKALDQLNTSYVDLMLVHWPHPAKNSQTSDPNCKLDVGGSPQACRRSTWKGMEKALNEGKVRCVGVSNFESGHIEDILTMPGLQHKPALNQFEYHPYWHEEDLVEYCRQNGIVFNGYSPLGAPDEALATQKWAKIMGSNYTLLNDKAIVKIAEAHRMTPAQVILQWHYQMNVPTQPRTQQRAHMRMNLDRALHDGSFCLSEAEIGILSKLPNPTLKVTADPRNYTGGYRHAGVARFIV